MSGGPSSFGSGTSFEQLLPYYFAAFILLAAANALWKLRLRKVADRYEKLRAELGGPPLRPAGTTRAGSARSRRSPLIAPGWLSLLPLLLIVWFLWSTGWFGETPFDLSSGDPTRFFGWLFIAIVGVNLAQIGYSQFFSKWAAVRRRLRRAVFAYDAESRDLMIREALASDPDVGERARATGSTVGVVEMPPAGLGPAPGPEPPNSGRGPRLSDAPPPL